MGKNNKYRNWMVAPMNEVNELFTKENVEQIVVPQIVKDDLLSIIEEKLTSLYSRITVDQVQKMLIKKCRIL